MSGEAGGTIIGGILLIGALPYILVAAAAAATVYGVVKLGSVAVSAAVEAEKKKQVQIDNCSEDLQQMYSRINTALDAQNVLSEQYYQKVEQDMERLSSAIQQATAKKADTSVIDEMVQHAKAETARAFGTSHAEEMRRIQAETAKEAAATLSAIEQAQQLKVDAVNWTSTTQAALIQQRTMMMELMKDAKASVNMLQKLATSGSCDTAFVEKVNSMVESYNTAAKAMDREAYQVATATAQRIITQSASIMLEHENEQFETDNVRVALVSRLEGLREELVHTRTVSFEDKSSGRVDEDLDMYVHGEITNILETVNHLLHEIASNDGVKYSKTKLRYMLERVESDLIPAAENVVAKAQKEVLSLYERLHAMDLIAEYMYGQGYVQDGVDVVGGEDVTEKLVVHFKDLANGNTVAVTLDEEASPEAIDRMAMQIMTYYANGRGVTEMEKAEMRDGITRALNSKGLNCSLCCTGSVGAEAADKRYNDIQRVRQMKPEKRSNDPTK